MQEDTPLLSCDPRALYGRGTLYDGEIDLDRLVATAERFPGAVEVLAEIYPHAAVARAPIHAVDGPDPAFRARLAAHFTQLDRHYPAVGPALLVRIRHAIVWRNMIFAVADDRAIPIYEFYRQTERAEKGRHLVARLAAAPHRQSLDLSGSAGLFVGSAGSFNYGHWLVDDFPVLACAGELRRGGAPIRVLMSRYYDALDRIRMEGTALALGERPTYAVTMLDLDTAYRVENLHYVTPVSYHPITKNPAAIAFIRDTFEGALFDVPSPVEATRIFIDRSSAWTRRLVNADAVRAVLRAFAYHAVAPDALSLREQWATFARAERVAGIMGAGMTSSVLSPRDAPVTYLSATGWEEPFFWDLAAMGGQRYTAVFGPDAPSGEPLYKRDFAIDPDILAAHLAALG